LLSISASSRKINKLHIPKFSPYAKQDGTQVSLLSSQPFKKRRMEPSLSLRDEMDSAAVDDSSAGRGDFCWNLLLILLWLLVWGMFPSSIPSSTDAATVMTPSSKESSSSAAPVLAEVAGLPMPPVLP
jgi:hypothetical protein